MDQTLPTCPTSCLRISDSTLIEPLQDTHPYPADRAFVISLHRSADVGAGQMRGRIVYLAGDQRADFATCADLLPTLQALIATCLCLVASH